MRKHPTTVTLSQDHILRLVKASQKMKGMPKTKIHEAGLEMALSIIENHDYDEALYRITRELERDDED